jgi:hypothetical protein
MEDAGRLHAALVPGAAAFVSIRGQRSDQFDNPEHRPAENRPVSGGSGAAKAESSDGTDRWIGSGS